MARLALAGAGAVAGFLIGGPLGAQIGFTLGGVVGSLLFPGKLPAGPRVNDLIVSTATDGAAIPFGYGQQRIAGNIIFAPPIVETSKTQSAKGGPKQTTYTYTATLAVAFCEGPCQMGRIWFDSKVVYDPKAVLTNPGAAVPNYQIQAPITGSSQVGNQILVQSTLDPPVGTQVTISAAPQGNGTFEVISSSPTQFSYYNPKGVAPGSSGTAALPPVKYPAPVIYPGTETQQADPTIQAAVGAANCPAFRGLCYAVWTNFPLNDFGNRIPNVRAEVTFGTVQVGSADPAVDLTFGGHIRPVNNPPQSSQLLVIFASPGQVQEWVISEISSNANMGVAPGNPVAGLSEVWISPLKSPPAPTELDYSWTGSPGGAVMAFSMVTGDGLQPNIAQKSNSGSPGTLSFNNPVPAGHLIAVLVGLGVGPNGPGQTPPTIAVSDDQGNLYTEIGFVGSATDFSAGVWVFQNPTNNPKAITVSEVGGTGGYTWINTSILDIANPSPTGQVVYGGPSLASIVSDISLRSGLQSTDIDVTELLLSGSPAAPIAGPIGYVVTRPTTGQSALKPLAMAFFFDGVETNGTLKYVPRGGPNAAISISESDLGLYKDKYKLVEQITQQQDLPRDIQVLFLDKSLDYQQNKTQKIRHSRIVKTRQETVMELPMVLDSGLARQISEKALFLAYLERKPFDFNLWKALYLLLDPTDVVPFTYEGLSFLGRIVKSNIGADLQTQLSLVNENASNYLSSVAGSSASGGTPGSVKTVPATILLLFDIPLLRDSDSNPAGTGYYFGMGAIGAALLSWPGASLQKSSDNVNFAEDDHSGTAVNFGNALNTLGPLPRRGGGLGGLSPWVWDMVNTLTVFMYNGSLAGTSDLNVYNGANAMLVGSELIQYANVTQNADGSFTLSRLLRGRRGTEGFAGSHGTGELVVDLNKPGIVRHDSSSADLQVLRYYEAVTYGATVDPTQSTLFTIQGQDLFPYAVTSVAGSRNGAGDLSVSWVRRTRIGGDWLEGIGTVPLSEVTESYDVEVVRGNGTVARTFSGLTSPQVTYTAAQQTADFGSPLLAVTFNIYQNSSVIGRGFKKTVTL